MTGVGVYVLRRLGLLLFGPEAGASVDFGRAWLFAIGAVTVAAGMAGLLAVRDLGKLGGYNLVVSAGTLLAAIGLGNVAVTAGAIFYLAISTLGAASLFLMAGLIVGQGEDSFREAERLEAYDPAEEGVYPQEDERAVVIGAPVGLIRGTFLAINLMVAGVAPL